MTAPVLCLSGSAVLKAGANVSTAFTEANYTELINQAESFIVVATEYDWVTNYGTISTNKKKILEEATSNMTAIYLIEYDMSGYTTRQEAENMINILRDRYMQCIGMLVTETNKDYLKGA